ncbi:MAG: alpha-N-arabinofuranosidase [Velocimicrobium sp.]
MKQAKISINKKFKKGQIDKRIYGSFVEHMGRVVYSGIYEPDHPKADEDGFRQDVLDIVKNMGVTCVRYPGGNYISAYDWKDTVGPIEERPRRLEIAWRAIETNEFGTNEFMKWAKKADVEPIFALNLGTKGIDNAISFVEYCNIEGGTLYSDLRKKHGSENPHAIKTWCLGNEMDGDWQIGHKTAKEYGRLAQETAKAIRQVDSEIQLVSCGSSKSTMESFPEWEATTLECTYDYVDYISLHQYYGGQEKGTSDFLAQSLDMEQYIKTVLGTCEYVKAKKHSSKDLFISFDEWGVWAMSDTEVAAQVDKTPWRIAPELSEQIYSMEDTLLFASMLMNFLKYADRIKIACQSLLTNISAAIMTEKGGEVWLQPIYFPFAYTSKYGRGVALSQSMEIPTYTCEEFSQVPCVDSVMVYNQDENEVVIFQVNRTEETISISLDLENFNVLQVIEHVVLSCDNIKETNLKEHDRIKPKTVNDVEINKQNVSFPIAAYSWNMIRVKVS